MTASTPRNLSNDPPVLSSAIDTAGKFDMNHETPTVERNRHLLDQQLPSLPSSLSCTSYGIPASLALPVLVPRRREQKIGGNDCTAAASLAHPTMAGGTANTLMDFVSHMSISDAQHAASHSFSRRPLASEPSFAFTLTREPPKSKDDDDKEEEEENLEQPGRQSQASSFSSNTSSQPLYVATQWSLTTPETMKATISTPQGFRFTSQKRKSPVVQCTPVNGNRPLMLPSLSSSASTTHGNTRNAPTPSFCYCCHCCTDSCRSHQGRCKRAKNYKSMLSNAPMLPSSPDLEDRMMVPSSSRLYHLTACFSPDAGGVTFVNPRFIAAANARRDVFSTSTFESSPLPPALPSMTAVAASMATAGLPSLDEAERSAPKWLRMKRRHSLLSALRLAVTET